MYRYVYWIQKFVHYLIYSTFFILTGFHLSASVNPPANLNPLGATYNVAVTFDRRRITSCNCTCTSTAYWCSHVVAVCLYRIHLVSQLKFVFFFVMRHCLSFIPLPNYFFFHFSSLYKCVYVHQLVNLCPAFIGINCRNLLSI